VPHAEQEMITLPEHLISPLVFIEVHVVLSFVSPCFIFWSCLLDFEFLLFLSFDCLVSIIFTFTCLALFITVLGNGDILWLTLTSTFTF